MSIAFMNMNNKLLPMAIHPWNTFIQTKFLQAL